MAPSSSRLRYVLMGEWMPIAPPWLRVVIDLWLIALVVGVFGQLVGNIQLTGIVLPLWALRVWLAWSRRPDRGSRS